MGKNTFELFKTKTEFLGLKVRREAISIDEDRKQAITDWLKPSILSGLRSFVGPLQFFKSFIKDFSKIEAPLTNLTRKNSSIHKWDSALNTAFAELNRRVIESPILQLINWRKPLRFHVDACQVSVGGTLTQLDDQVEDYSPTYFSRRLSPPEDQLLRKG